PSIAEWIRLAPPASFEGRRLDEAGEPPDLVSTATSAQFPIRFALRTGRHKLVESLDTGGVALFDLEQDPGEHPARLAADPATARGRGERPFAARDALRRRGYAATVVGPAAGRAHVRLRLEGPSEHGVFQTIDRTGEPAPGMRLTMTEDAAS